MGKTPEQVRGVTVSPGQWGNVKNSSGVTGIGGYQTGVTGSDRIRDGIAFDGITFDGFALAEGSVCDYFCRRELGQKSLLVWCDGKESSGVTGSPGQGCDGR